jgi:RHS repeat-associated protein
MKHQNGRTWLALFLVAAVSPALACKGCNKGGGEELGDLVIEDCENGEDDDGDGKTDCEQAVCQLREVCVQIPPDPGELAPPMDSAGFDSFADSVRFLWEGDNKVVFGLDEDALDESSVAVLRGKVLDADGEPVSGLRASIAGRPELGYTYSRSDGAIDLVANGGAPVTVRFEGADFPAVDRDVLAETLDYSNADDIVATPYDDKATEVNLRKGGSHAATVASDGDGDRSMKMYFRSGTTAEVEMPDGRTTKLRKITVKATEFTVGDTGFDAMPARLPEESAYTYASELTVEEAQRAGASRVHFDKPVTLFLENFLGLEAGTVVPSGVYDRESRAWVPSTNGLVAERVSGGVDIDGDGSADSKKTLKEAGYDGIGGAVEEFFDEGETFWLVNVDHFSPYDLNFPYEFPEDAIPPDIIPDFPEQEDEDPCDEEGSTIECENQVLGKEVGLPGTDLSLTYRSDRVVGRGRSFEFDLTDDSPPESLQKVTVKVRVGGHRFEEEFPPEPNLTYRFDWDGTDAYGREVRRPHRVRMSVQYWYEVDYTAPEQGLPAFGNTGSASLRNGRLFLPITRTYEGELGSMDARSVFGTGGWQLSAHHAWDGDRRTLYPGGAPERDSGDVGRIIRNYETFARGRSSLPLDPWDGQVVSLLDVALDRDGSLLLGLSTTRGSKVIVRRLDDGTFEHVAGEAMPSESRVQQCFLDMANCNEGRSIEESLIFGSEMEVAPNGDIYVPNGRCLRRIRDDQLEIVAGDTCFPGEEPDGQPSFPHIDDLTVGPTGEVYATNGSRVYRLFPGEQRIELIAGGCSDCDRAVPAGTSALEWDADADHIAATSDGSVYVAGSYPDALIMRITPAGTVQPVWNGGDESDIRTLTAAPDDTLYFTDVEGIAGSFIKRLAGQNVTTVAGIGVDLFSPELTYLYDQALNADNTPATSTLLIIPPMSLAVDGQGRIFYSTLGALDHPDVEDDDTVPLIKVVENAFGDVIDKDEALLASVRGDRLSRYDRRGRIAETTDALMGGTIRSFNYDDAGRLSSITDADVGDLVVERDGDGRLAAIVAPDGVRTEFEIDDQGYIETFRFSDGSTIQATYDDGGLLESWTDPNGATSTYEYDVAGMLTRVEDAEGGWKELERVSGGVRLSTSSGRSVVHGLRGEVNIFTGEIVTTDAAGLEWRTKVEFDRGRTLTKPDGTELRTVETPDPRFGFQSTFVGRRSTVTPSGLEQVAERTREYEYADPSDRSSVTRRVEELTVNGETWTSEWDVEARTQTVTSPEGRTIVTAFDDQGRRVSRKHGNYSPIEWTWHDDGRLSEVRQGNRWTRFVWSGGAVERVESSSGETIERTLDDGGRATSMERGNASWSFEYDAAGNLTEASTSAGTRVSYAYDGRDNVAEWTAGESGDTTTTSYDVDRRPLEMSTPTGDASWTYDEAGRTAGVSSNVDDLSRTFDPDTGKVTRLQTNDVTTDLTWDGFLLQSSRHQFGPADVTVERGFDNNFWVTRRTIGGRDINYDHDLDGYLTQAGPMTITRDSAGNAVATEVGDVSHERTFDQETGLLTGETYAVGNTDVFAYTLEYDDAGRIVRRVETVEGATTTIDYAYDDAGRLVSVERDVTPTESYAWTGATRRTDANGETATYDDDGRLTSLGTLSLSHTGAHVTEIDDGGDVLTLGYGPMSRARDGEDAVGTFRFAYDGYGRRVALFRDGAFDRGWVYDDFDFPVAEVDSSGDVRSRFVYALHGHVPDVMIRGGDNYRLVTDYLGTVRMVIDASTGDIVQRADFDAFGNPISQTAPDFQPFGWAGALDVGVDPLLGFPARLYDPRTARWCQPDPDGVGGGSVDLLAYPADPINMADRQGEAVGVAIAVVAIGLGGVLFADHYNDFAKETSKEAVDKWDSTHGPGDRSDDHNGPGDAIKHCTINCEGAKNYSTPVARFFSWANEGPKAALHGYENPADEEAMDFHNNQCGRDLANEEPETDCYEGCVDKYFNGELEVMPRHTWD